MPINPTPSWQHNETDAEGTAQAAFATAISKAWSTIPKREATRYYRLLMLLTLQAGTLSADPPRPTPGGPIIFGNYKASHYGDKQRLWIASTILRWPLLIALPDRGGMFQMPPSSISSVDGEPALLINPNDTGEITILTVIAVCAISAAVVACANWGWNVLDRHLARKADHDNLVFSTAQSIELILNHVKEEKAAGKKLPWPPEKLRALEKLEAIQQSIADKKETPLPMPFENAISSVGAGIEHIGEGVKGAGEGAGKGMEKAGEWLLPAAIVGGCALLAFSMGRK